MGLGFIGSKASWSYSGFMAFRSAVWRDCGFSMTLREAYESTLKFESIISKDHPLYDFFNHSDCDGKLTSKQMKKIIPVLQKIIEGWETTICGFDNYDKSQGLLLVNDMKKLVLEKKSLEFC